MNVHPFIIFASINFFLLGLIWRSSDVLNVFIKGALLLSSFWGFLIMLRS